MKLKDKYLIQDPTKRLYGLPVPIIGLTGGIASGKSTVGRLLLSQGLPLINADHLVKDVYALPETFQLVEARYPEVIEQGVINFARLRELVFSDENVKKEIEEIIYERLPSAFQRAFEKLVAPKIVVYDVPLLFEKKMTDAFDVTALVYAPRKIQKERLMIRDGHHELMAENILQQQMDIEEKKLLADFTIQNSATEAELAEEVKQFLRQVLLAD